MQMQTETKLKPINPSRTQQSANPLYCFRKRQRDRRKRKKKQEAEAQLIFTKRLVLARLNNLETSNSINERKSWRNVTEKTVRRIKVLEKEE